MNIQRALIRAIVPEGNSRAMQRMPGMDTASLRDRRGVQPLIPVRRFRLRLLLEAQKMDRRRVPNPRSTDARRFWSFDEGTLALDTITEAELLRVLEPLRRDRALIIVTCR